MVSISEKASSLGRKKDRDSKIIQQHWENIDRVKLLGRWVEVFNLNPQSLFDAGTKGKNANRIWDYMGFGPFEDQLAMELWLNSCAESNDPIYVGFKDKSTGIIGGMGSFMQIRPSTGVVEIGNIWLGIDWRNDVRGTESISLMMHYVLEALGYRRLEWKCNALNNLSRRAALRFGFRFEGEFLNHMIVKGRSRDTAWFSITDTEWPNIRVAHDSWLSSTNFDNFGRQKSSLSTLTKSLWF